MVTINLLSWRAYARAYERKQIQKILLGTMLLAFSLMSALHLWLSNQQHNLQIRLYALDKQRQLQQQTSGVVTVTTRDRNTVTAGKLLHVLGQSINPVCFTDIVREQDTVSFAGRAHTTADLTDFLLQWHLADLFSVLRIEQLQRDNPQAVEFRLRGLNDVTQTQEDATHAL